MKHCVFSILSLEILVLVQYSLKHLALRKTPKALCSMLLFFMALNAIQAQTIIQGTITDADTKMPLPFCNITIRGTTKGGITNADGKYYINVNLTKDTLVVSYMGYIAKTVAASWLNSNNALSLQKKAVKLKQVDIVGNSDVLYELLEKCRNRLLKVPNCYSKAYFQMETAVEKQPVEMLECYYNAHLKGNAIKELLLKNGRIGVAATQENSFFKSLNTTKAFTTLSLTNQNPFLPAIPLQFRKATLKKKYKLHRLIDDDSVCHIQFLPRININAFFAGDVWMDKHTNAILKIQLTCANTAIHPFLPLFEGGSLDSVNLNIIQVFQNNGTESNLNNMQFNYSFKYNNGQPKGRISNGNKLFYTVNTNSVVYCYAYNSQFILPYFDYDTDASDYRKIATMPYNAAFWDNNQEMAPTEKQMQSLAFIQKNGLLINYFNKNSKTSGNYTVFEDNNILWNKDKRVALKKDKLASMSPKDTILKKQEQQFKSNLYHLKVQLYLDLNSINDSIIHYSATVFDIYQTYFDLPADSNTNCFLNLYFDIWEIGRQNLEKTLLTHNWQLSAIDSIYKLTLTQLETTANSYLKEVAVGANIKALEKWNNYVKQYLNIDNKAMMTHRQ